jgi:hypothetical protein
MDYLEQQFARIGQQQQQQAQQQQQQFAQIGQQQQRIGQQQQQQQNQLNAVVFESKKINESLPAFVREEPITPSTGSTKLQVSNKIFSKLGLNTEPTVDVKTYKAPTDYNGGKKLGWTWMSASTDDSSDSSSSSSSASSASLESKSSPSAACKSDEEMEIASYAVIKQYLDDAKLQCRIVGNGQNLPDGLLFDAKLFTLRQQNPFEKKFQPVYFVQRLRGRTDVVVLRQDIELHGQILQHHVDFAIEVKTPSQMQSSKSKCVREAALQLIGLNAENHQWTPAVILTNLVKTHLVLYLKKDGVEPVQYSIHSKRCSTFRAAVHLVCTMERPKISADFSRCPSPPASEDSTVSDE